MSDRYEAGLFVCIIIAFLLGFGSGRVTAPSEQAKQHDLQERCCSCTQAELGRCGR